MKYEITIKPIDEEAKKADPCYPDHPVIVSKFMFVCQPANDEERTGGGMCGSIEDIALLISNANPAILGAARVGVAIHDATVMGEDPLKRLLRGMISK